MATSFIAPFIATFFIAMFVLIMQFLWTYIDDIIGKGAGFWMLTELLGYLSMSLIPTALPIAILISSVMVMGNMAEHYELSSFKSAGVPLSRVMMPLMLFTIGISFFSYFCSNNLMPVTNLKFKSRLHDIRRQKPTMSLEEGVFNEDFKGFNIHIGSKGKDNESISDVKIYNHDYSNRDRTSIIVAKEGKMFATDDEQFFVMHLTDGTQYQETKPANIKDKSKDKSHPFVRTQFKEWTKVFDLTQFEIDNTDEQLFQSHHTMLTTRQLRAAIDSLDVKLDRRLMSLNHHLKKHFQLTKKEAQEDAKKLVSKKQKESKFKQKIIDRNKRRKDSLDQIKRQKINAPTKVKKPKQTSTTKKLDQKKSTTTTKPVKKNKPKGRKTTVRTKALKQIIDKPLGEYDSFVETVAITDRSRLFTKSKSFARSIRDQAGAAVKSIHRTGETRVKHIWELNFKFSMAVVCFIFLFIGGPMGAIIRKGGFGYPLLVAIFFFVLFMILNIFCKKLAESFVLNAVFASWVPCLILFPIGVTLTYRAMNDSQPIDFSWLIRIFDFFRNRTLKFWKPKVDRI